MVVVVAVAGTPKPKPPLAPLVVVTLPKLSPTVGVFVAAVELREKPPVAGVTLVVTVANKPNAGFETALASPAPVVLENWSVGAAEAEMEKICVFLESKVRMRNLPVGADVVGSVKPLAVFGTPKLNDIVVCV